MQVPDHIAVQRRAALIGPQGGLHIISAIHNVAVQNSLDKFLPSWNIMRCSRFFVSGKLLAKGERMSGPQIFLLGIMVAWTPSLIFLAYGLRDRNILQEATSEEDH